jgi:bifunctional NMN adenylyltransferase/nudix hydrolase
MNTTGVIIGRFQTPYLHDGHRYLLDQLKAKHHKIVLILGVSPVKGSKRNPFDFYTREKLLKKAYPDFIILPLADHPLDSVWSANLDDLLVTSFPNEHFILYGSRDSFIPFYSGRLHTEELPVQGEYSATMLRKEYADKVMDSDDFRLGINYAYHNSYSKVFPTVDIAVFRESKTYLLLGRKKNRKEWRLPGGFVDVNDMDFEAAARRELTEECGNIEVAAMNYVGSARIDDWRYSNEEDKITTMLFATDLVYGEPVAGDDLREVRWFGVSDLEKLLANGMVAKEHLVLLKLLQKKVLNKETDLTTQNLDYENS